MLDTKQHRRIARKCTEAIAGAIDKLPALLESCEAEDAAVIVADLIKACIGLPDPHEDPGASLAEVIRQIHEDDDDQRSNLQTSQPSNERSS